MIVLCRCMVRLSKHVIHVPMHISCVLNAVIMVERLLRNTGSVSHIAGFHTAKHLNRILF